MLSDFKTSILGNQQLRERNDTDEGCNRPYLEQAARSAGHTLSSVLPRRRLLQLLHVIGSSAFRSADVDA